MALHYVLPGLIRSLAKVSNRCDGSYQVISRLILKFGRFPGAPALTVPVTPVTVFVGPNNSGKSKVLAEILQFCQSGQRNVTNVIMDAVEFSPIPGDQVDDKLNRVTLTPRPGEAVQPGHIIIGKRGVRNNIAAGSLAGALQNPNTQMQILCQWYLAFNTLKLDGANRISLTNQQNAGDLQQQPHTSLQVLFQDDKRRADVRRIVYDAFGSYFVIDPTQIGHLRIRLSPRAPADSIEERGWHEAAVKFHANALPIEQTSDGVKAFTGIITEIIAGDPVILLIDEPEAFLHPALAFTLGKEIGTASSGSEKRLFVSTHSPNFVMGCIQSAVSVNIVRLTYRADVATARILPSAEILTLMRNPLLRSTGVLSALFYEYVVVTESDADRAFYQEVNERLLRYQADLGIPNCLFINAQNRQTVQTIIRPLRQLGIPAAGIVDVDVLKDGGGEWTKFLDGGFVPEIDRKALATARAEIKQRLDDTKKDMKRDGGIDLLQKADQESASNLFDRLEQYGLFVVRGGELESWLKGLGAGGHGPAWLISIFEKMGDDPDAPDYLRPGEGDVWAFMGRIKRWLSDPRRRGIPE